jgi:hypothetical protein
MIANLGILLVPDAVGIVTVITIVLIGAILAVYLIVLKKNGWIGTSNYRCPNPNCKKIFHSPLRVKDFSNDKEIGLACPECGYDLSSSKNEETLKDTIIENKPGLKTQQSSTIIISKVATCNKTIQEAETLKTNSTTVGPYQYKTPQKTNINVSREIINESKPETKKESTTTPIEKLIPAKDTIKEVKAPENPSPTLELKSNVSPQKINTELIQKQKEDDPKTRPEGCNHYLGYLSSLSKGTKTPDECFACAQLIECLRVTKD